MCSSDLARTVPPDPERLVGTDDTRASLHLAEVVLGHGRDALVDETFGAAVARDVAARGETWVAVADLHGHPAALDALIAWCDAHLGPEYRLATLGDYCDNGPDVPGLLDRLVRLSDERGDRFVPILGNHDLACLRAMADEGWYEQWSRLYWNAEIGRAHV